ncbi:MAG: glycerate kinase [Jatrophihabitantaceae bacterium]
MNSRLRVLVAPDKLRGTATAAEAAQAISEGVTSAGGVPELCPLADGGEGFLDVLGGPNRRTEVSDALGRPIRIPWRLDGETAVIETAMLSTDVLRSGPGPAEALAATSEGAGQLIAAALDQGAKRVLVGLGGSAFTDGGIGALAALGGQVPFRPGLQVVLGCDVSTGYLDAARVFSPQKGAGPPAVATLTTRLADQAAMLRSRFGRDISRIPGTGAAGGLAGGLHAAGAELDSGFAMVASRTGLDRRLAGCDLVITAEGRLDASSLAGKVVGGLIERSARPVWVLAGSIAEDPELAGRIEQIDLSVRFGNAARSDVTGCLRRAAAELIQNWGSSSTI